jgi:hypothetical protein
LAHLGDVKQAAAVYREHLDWLEALADGEYPDVAVLRDKLDAFGTTGH